MKLPLAVGLLAIATFALAQSQAPERTNIPADCTEKNPCAVTTNLSTGQQAVSHSLPPGTYLPPLPPPGNGGDGYDSPRIYEGPEILSLEETAVGYFREVAMIDSHEPGGNKPFDPHYVLWDRGDELTDAEAAEVLEVARHAASVEQQNSSGEFKAEQLQLCKELNAAGTADALVAAFQNADARTVARKKATGRALLEQLSPGARQHLNSVLIQHRKNTAVVPTDWSRAGKIQPEGLEMLRARMCLR